MKAVGQSWQTVFFLLERVLFTHQTSVVAIARSSVSDAARVRSNRGAPRFRRFRLFCSAFGSCVILFRRNRAHNGRIAEMLESQTVNGTRPEPLSAKTR